MVKGNLVVALSAIKLGKKLGLGVKSGDNVTA